MNEPSKRFVYYKRYSHSQMFPWMYAVFGWACSALGWIQVLKLDF